MPKINLFTEDVNFTLKQKNKIKTWIKSTILEEGYALEELNFIFCSDEYLYQINVDYLDHDDYTDIITFDNSEEEKAIEGDIFISIDRVKENAEKHQQSEERELSRVISHGLYHLTGYKDKSDSEAKQMRAKEEFAIELFEKL